MRGRIERAWYDRGRRRVRDLFCGDTHVILDLELRRVFCRDCGKVKQEKLDWLADCPFYTKRFACFVGRRCRESSIRDVARETCSDWKTVKGLEEQCMREQLRRAGTPGPKVIGIDEVSVGKGHRHAIVVSDLPGTSRQFIKGQKYTLLSRRRNLTGKGRASLKLLLKANKRLNTAYLLKESFGQLWHC